MMVNTINFNLAINVQVSMGFPTITRTNFGNSIHDFVIFSRFLEIKLIAWECEDTEFCSIFNILFNEGIKINVLLGVS